MEWLTANWVWLLLGSFLIVSHFITYRRQRSAGLEPVLIKQSRN